MNRSVYSRLAWTGIRSNRELYRPYLLAGIVLAAGFYILLSLSSLQSVHDLKGGEAVTALLAYAVKLFGVFSLPFLLYADAAVLKRRKREFGLYNVLGMDKRNLLRVLVWEAALTFAVSTGAGCAAGVVLSKFAELSIAAIMAQRTDDALHWDARALGLTALVYLGIHAVVLAVAAVQVWRGDPVRLLRSESEGEREPASRTLPALLGAALTAGAYLLSLTTLSVIKQNMTMRSGLVSDQPGEVDQALNNILVFVIGRMSAFALLAGAGTLLLFVAGSVFLCSALKNRASYYYRPAHFVSVSQLRFRMKRSGVSLAVICILSTVILIALTGAAGFFSGIRGTIDRHYPHDLCVYAEAPPDAAIGSDAFGGAFRAEADAALDEAGIESRSGSDLYFAGLYAAYTDGVLDLTADLASGWDSEIGENRIEEEVDGLVCVRVVSIGDYNRLTGASEPLAAGETLLAAPKGIGGITRVRALNGGEYPVRTRTQTLPSLTPFTLMGHIPDAGGLETVVLAVPDLAGFFGGFDRDAWTVNEVRYLWEYDIDTDAPSDAQDAAFAALRDRTAARAEAAGIADAGCFLRLERLGAASGLSGGLLFLAFAVTALLLFVTALIMYDKQVSEGYEDRKRFVVMRKVGMTEAEVRRSVNAQMRTVFFFPLLMAGVHLAFAVPLVRLILLWTVRPSDSVVLLTACASFLVFAAAYLLMYARTARTYVRVVNRGHPFRRP